MTRFYEKLGEGNWIELDATFEGEYSGITLVIHVAKVVTTVSIETIMIEIENFFRDVRKFVSRGSGKALLVDIDHATTFFVESKNDEIYFNVEYQYRPERGEARCVIKVERFQVQNGIDLLSDFFLNNWGLDLGPRSAMQ